MKTRIILTLLCLILLSGCNHGIGSFEKGNLDLPALYTKINEQIGDNVIQMPLLNDRPWTKKEIEKKYHLDMTIIEDCMVKSSLIDVQTAEIALFKVPKEKDQELKQAIRYRLDSLESSLGSYHEDVKNRIHNAKQGRIGEYYYLVLGEDGEKVVNYMKNGA